jgi:hypothetical protein
MRLIQCDHQGQVHAALVENDKQVRLLDAETLTLARRAIGRGKPLGEIVASALTETRLKLADFGRPLRNALRFEPVTTATVETPSL